MSYRYVSIVIPLFNVDIKILNKSLESISKQTYLLYEVIIIDDSSDIECSKFCFDYCSSDVRFRYYKTPKRLGLSKSLNFGISLAKHDLIARFDSDDICFLNRLELQIDYFNNNRNIDVLGGSIQIIDDSELVTSNRSYPIETNKIRKRMQIDCSIAHPTVMFKKHLVTEYGGYNEDFVFAEDIEMWLRWLNFGVRFSNLENPLIKYRQTDFVRNRKHYTYFLRARLKNFNLNMMPYNLIGIIILLLAQVLPAKFMLLYYKYKS